MMQLWDLKVYLEQNQANHQGNDDSDQQINPHIHVEYLQCDNLLRMAHHLNIRLHLPWLGLNLN